MRIDFRGLDIRMAEQFLKQPDIDAGFQHVRRETVAPRMASHFALCDSCNGYIEEPPEPDPSV